MVIDPSSATQYTLSGGLNGVVMRDNSDTSVTSKTVKAALDQELALSIGILSAFSGEGETTIEYDNVLVQTVR
jgi:hypothetical protein